ncbi:glycosyltransferase involved in cell wall biosynthesis [Tenacibaculum adriaticum]|uniref:Glycosyltransferase involved in cell wall biosynthesis n=1 Tax=Tenacibaculum adriaticum TaxID=413713 RepID=A0A5S5DTX5_9FLAO|nr:glycosyltransferase [Tenacibaculum adriaticum]TYP98818.1 glycosyltransferase involved in cell wall biosynthesis [Tenacibaculum adriaticum]
MKTCVLFCPTDTWGGVEKNVLLRANFLTKKGYTVYVVILKHMFEEKFLEFPKIKIINVNSRGGDINMFVVMNYVKILKKIKPDIVFSALKKDWFLVSLSARIARVPRILLYLGIYRKIKNNIKYKFVFNILKPKVIVNSNSLKNHLLKTTSFFNSSNLFRIYNGFELPLLDGEKLDLNKKFNLPDNTIFVGCAGRLSPMKGFDLLPKILKNLPDNIHVIVAGEGKYEEQIKNEINKSKEAKRIHFLGHLSNIHLFFRSIDLFLLCSRKEGMANVLNEALSHGLPSISTKVSGSEELLGYGKYGILTEVEDTEAMAKGILQIINKEVVFDKNDLRKWIKDSFSMKLMETKTEELFFSDLKKL